MGLNHLIKMNPFHFMIYLLLIVLKTTESSNSQVSPLIARPPINFRGNLRGQNQENPKIFNIGAVLDSPDSISQFLQVRKN